MSNFLKSPLLLLLLLQLRKRSLVTINAAEPGRPRLKKAERANDERRDERPKGVVFCALIPQYCKWCVVVVLRS